MRRIEPDDEDLRIASTHALPGCPFCGAQPISFQEANDETGLVVARVACTRCHGNVHYCGRDRDEARQGAIRDWSRRTPIPAPHAPLTAVPPQLTATRLTIGDAVTIHRGGRIEVNPAYETDEVAREFWRAVERLAPAFVRPASGAP